MRAQCKGPEQRAENPCELFSMSVPPWKYVNCLIARMSRKTNLRCNKHAKAAIHGMTQIVVTSTTGNTNIQTSTSQNGQERQNNAGINQHWYQNSERTVRTPSPERAAHRRHRFQIPPSKHPLLYLSMCPRRPARRRGAKR